MTGRHWLGEAQAAFDQALANAPQDASFAEPEFWLQRAQVAATIASAEQQRIANLIAWKQLQATRASASDQGVGMLPLGTDETADEIEQALGIAEPPAPVQQGGELCTWTSPCPSCGAGIGEPCHSPNGEPVEPHATRGTPA